MKFNVSQMLLLVTLVALGIVFVREWTAPPWVWNNWVLSYAKPDVPSAFDDRNRPAPKYQFGKDVRFEYTDGHSMYSEMHKRGWESAREAFFKNTELALKRYPPIVPSDNSKWTVDHWHAGSDLGATECADQIEKLISNSNEDAVRGSLAYHRNWHIIPISLLMIMVMAGIISIGYRNSKKRTDSNPDC